MMSIRYRGGIHYNMVIVIAAIAIGICVIPQTAWAEGLVANINPVPSVEVSGYAAQFGVSLVTAEEHLRVQEQDLESIAQIREQLGPSYAGAWFNNQTGQLEVASVDTQAAAHLAPLLAATNGSAKIVTTHSSWSQLEEAQATIDRALAEPEQHQEITTGFDLESNAVLVRESSSASPSTEAEVDAAIAGSPAGVKVEVKHLTASKIAVTPDANSCTYENGKVWLHCAPPLRGGVTVEENSYSCTDGFLGYYPSNGQVQYVLTAGHCTKGNTLGENGTTWYAVPPGEKSRAIGPAWNWKIGENGDFGLIKIRSSSYWSPVWPGDFVVDTRPGGLGWENQMEKIVADDSPGLYNCHTGESSKTVCGEVLSVHNSFCYEGGEGCPGNMTEDSFSSLKGDSGGPVWGNNWAFGIDDSATSSGSPSYFSELEYILPAEGGLNISLGE